MGFRRYYPKYDPDWNHDVSCAADFIGQSILLVMAGLFIFVLISLVR